MFLYRGKCRIFWLRNIKILAEMWGKVRYHQRVPERPPLWEKMSPATWSIFLCFRCWWFASVVGVAAKEKQCGADTLKVKAVQKYKSCHRQFLAFSTLPLQRSCPSTCGACPSSPKTLRDGWQPCQRCLSARTSTCTCCRRCGWRITTSCCNTPWPKRGCTSCPSKPRRRSSTAFSAQVEQIYTHRITSLRYRKRALKKSQNLQKDFTV